MRAIHGHLAKTVHLIGGRLRPTRGGALQGGQSKPGRRAAGSQPNALPSPTDPADCLSPQLPFSRPLVGTVNHPEVIHIYTPFSLNSAILCKVYPPSYLNMKQQGQKEVRGCAKPVAHHSEVKASSLCLRTAAFKEFVSLLSS